MTPHTNSSGSKPGVWYSVAGPVGKVVSIILATLGGVRKNRFVRVPMSRSPESRIVEFVVRFRGVRDSRVVQDKQGSKAREIQKNTGAGNSRDTERA
ncbi:hypothetical protein FKM82_020890 [Ascaphus truei]